MNKTLIDVGASKIAHTQSGAGPDLVFVHGWPLDGRTFRHIVPVLEKRFTCHVLDLPGTGASEWTAGTRFTIDAHADAVGKVIEKLGLARVAFVAHDSGAAIARIVAARVGERCFGIVTGNTEIPAYRPPMLSLLVGLGRLPGGAAMFRATTGSRLFLRSPMGFGGAFENLDLLDGEFGELFVKPLRDPRVFAGQWGMVRDFDWTSIDQMEATHRRITAKVALIWGKDDPWFPLERLRPTVGQFAGGAELHVLPGKVFVHEERPREFAELAAKFLERAVSGRAAA